MSSPSTSMDSAAPAPSTSLACAERTLELPQGFADEHIDAETLLVSVVGFLEVVCGYANAKTTWMQWRCNAIKMEHIVMCCCSTPTLCTAHMDNRLVVHKITSQRGGNARPMTNYQGCIVLAMWSNKHGSAVHHELLQTMMRRLTGDATLSAEILQRNAELAQRTDLEAMMLRQHASTSGGAAVVPWQESLQMVLSRVDALTEEVASLRAQQTATTHAVEALSTRQAALEQRYERDDSERQLAVHFYRDQLRRATTRDAAAGTPMSILDEWMDRKNVFLSRNDERETAISIVKEIFYLHDKKRRSRNRPIIIRDPFDVYYDALDFWNESYSAAKGRRCGFCEFSSRVSKLTDLTSGYARMMLMTHPWTA